MQRPVSSRSAERELIVRRLLSSLCVASIAGQGRYRNLWEHYYAEAEGIIFVIDSAESVRMCVVKDELDTLLAHKDIAKKVCPILFFANKSDLPKALTPAQISEALELQKLTRPWNIVSEHTHNVDRQQGAAIRSLLLLPSFSHSRLGFVMIACVCRASNALNGTGLEEGVKWLTKHLTAA